MTKATQVKLAGSSREWGAARQGVRRTSAYAGI
jgi:hypothetical protein